MKSPLRTEPVYRPYRQGDKEGNMETLIFVLTIME